MEREREIFINGLTDENGNVEVEGCLRRGVSKSIAEEIFSEMESFASYAFNKSHAAAYANVSYKTAWLKCRYPKEYMAALLTSVLDNFGKLASYTEECARLNIKVLPPHVNYSMKSFTVDGENIRFGLVAVKNIGKSFIDDIICERENGDFTSFYDFCKRMYGKNMNSRALESLVKCGAFDGMGYNRREMVNSLKIVLESCERDYKRNITGQMSFFDDMEEQDSPVNQLVTSADDFSVPEKLAMEKEITGMYLSGHPVDRYKDIISRLKPDKIINICNADENRRYSDGDRAVVVGVLSNVKIRTTKNNQTMATAVIEDRSGSIEVMIFPQVFDKSGRLLSDGSVVRIAGSVSMREDEKVKLLCNDVTGIKQLAQEITRSNSDDGKSLRKPETNTSARSNADNISDSKNKAHLLYIRIDNLQSEKFKKVKNLLEIFDGNTQVVFRLTDTGKKVSAPRSLWVMLNEPLVRELKYILGDENVFVR